MKVLVIRFSSIGDVVLTTPIVRALKQQIANCEVHFLTKKPFKGILAQNPHIEKIFTIEKSISEVVPQLRLEKYDYIIDLHKNARTLSLKMKLGRAALSFPKLNFEKWLLVNFKRNSMPKRHVVDRYFEAVQKLGVKNDYLPCDFFINPHDEVDTKVDFSLAPKSFLTIAIGAQFATKRMPFNKLCEIINEIHEPIVLVGGPTDQEFAKKIIASFTEKSIISTCGKYSLAQSASIVKQSLVLLTNDTGMMHIASCFEIPTVSVWGSTVPELGMFPYFPKKSNLFSIHEVKELSCRPCSKIGFQKCPKGHFNCMQMQDSKSISSDILSKIK